MRARGRDTLRRLSAAMSTKVKPVSACRAFAASKGLPTPDRDVDITGGMAFASISKRFPVRMPALLL
jgi:hypothetical protein